MPLYLLSMFQISKQLDNVFAFYGNFTFWWKEEKQTKKKQKTKKLSQFLKVHILETAVMI